jgi:phospholipid transport system substrate-binding protein
MTDSSPCRRKSHRFTLGLCALVLMASWGFAAAPPSNAQQIEAVSRVNTLYIALLDTMKRAKQLGPKGRYERLLPVVAGVFDVAGMMRIALGTSGWEAVSPAQRSALVDAFARMMAATYASRFDDFAGETFEVSPAVDRSTTDKIVETRLIQSNGKTVMLNYLMRNTAEGWKISDVYLDGTISELAARRAEFGSIVKAGGPDALVNSLRQKSEKLLSGG